MVPSGIYGPMLDQGIWLSTSSYQVYAHLALDGHPLLAPPLHILLLFLLPCPLFLVLHICTMCWYTGLEMGPLLVQILKMTNLDQYYPLHCSFYLLFLLNLCLYSSLFSSRISTISPNFSRRLKGLYHQNNEKVY